MWVQAECKQSASSPSPPGPDALAETLSGLLELVWTPSALLELYIPGFSKLPAWRARGFLEICSNGKADLRKQTNNVTEDTSTSAIVRVGANSIIQNADVSLIWQDDLDKLTRRSRSAALMNGPFETQDSIVAARLLCIA